MSHELLLRLFLSPSYFSVYVALHYLTIYSENIGITYYLTRRLQEIDLTELQDVWNLFCHLLISRFSRSRAMESFILKMCEKSAHIALSTMWFMQAHLLDLTYKHRESDSFTTCQRVLHRCHTIIFEDFPEKRSGPYMSSFLHLLRLRVKPRIEPALVGIGCVLAGVPGLPAVTDIIGSTAIEQGRIDFTTDITRSLGQDAESGAFYSLNQPLDDSETGIEEAQDKKSEDGSENSWTVYLDKSNNNGLFELPERNGNFSESALKRPATPIEMAAHLTHTSHTPGQTDKLIKRPYQSSPLISTVKDAKEESLNFGLANTSSQHVDEAMLHHMLKVHFCRSEIQFITALESIATRLTRVPRPARLSALRAELVSINHRLPSEVCLPLWCDSLEDNLSGGTGKAHHRIVRLPPGESVVLNSAERAPYLIILEILNDNMDFDPSRPSNKEILRRPPMKQRNSSYTDGSAEQIGALDDIYKLQTDGNSLDSVGQSDSPLEVTYGNLEASSYGDMDDDEVDIVEQIYGTKFSVHQAPDITDEIILPLPRKNKELDAATWSKISPQPISYESKSNSTSSLSTWSTLLPAGVGSRDSKPSFYTPVVSLDDYSERMRTAAIMLAQLNSFSLTEVSRNSMFTIRSLVSSDLFPSENPFGWFLRDRQVHTEITNVSNVADSTVERQSDILRMSQGNPTKLKVNSSEAALIRDRIMEEMLALEEERVRRMHDMDLSDEQIASSYGRNAVSEDEIIIRREIKKSDPSAIVFQEPWAKKKSRIRRSSPYGHLASWDCVSVIVKTGTDLRQEQLAVQLIREFQRIWEDEGCACWVRYFKILITGGSSGFIETVTDAVSIHSIKKAEYARRIAEGRFSHVSLLDHFLSSYGDVSSARFIRAQRNFLKSLAGYSIVTYLLQIKDRHNGNILLDRDGHLIHIDFGFMLSNSPGNIGFEAAPFKLPFEYVELMGGLDSSAFVEYKKLFLKGFEAARKHSDKIITIVELVQKDSSLPCFISTGEQTIKQLKDRFQLNSSDSVVKTYCENLIMASVGSSWTRLYDTYQYYTQSIL